MNTKTDISAAYVGSTGVDKLCLGSEVVWESTPPGPVPYERQYLTFEIISGGSINWVGRTNTNIIEYKVNNGAWTQLGGQTRQFITVNTGDIVKFRGDNAAYGSSQIPAYGSFNYDTILSSPIATYKAYGNVMSLISSTGFTGLTSFSANYALCGLFSGGTMEEDGVYHGLVDVSNLVLPATGLTLGCYMYMFKGCTSLTAAPVLPATALTDSCYLSMFQGCSGLTQAPALPATTLANSCYNSMFRNCTSLTQASALPATTLAINCYSNMFAGCIRLTTAPELLATTLANNCYAGMFSGCTTLNTITCIASIKGTSYTNNWVKNVASTGTFYKDANATGWTRGANGIPSGWTVQDYVKPTVLKIAGQSITGTRDGSGDYDWGNLTQYSGTSFTIEVGGVPVTADTWDYGENYIDACGGSSEISHDTGTTMSVFEVNSGYISYVYYDPDNNSVGYVSDDDNTSDDPETICGCQGGCWDGETCQECPSEDPCDDWEGVGYSSYEECKCAHGYPEYCADPCDDWEGNGYQSWEECTCAERGENCPEEESGE